MKKKVTITSPLNLPTQARVGVSVVILNEKNEVLIGERQGSHGAGEFAVPGGHLEFGETYVECCDRELLEEIDINFGTYEKIGFSEDFFESNKINESNEKKVPLKKHFTTLYFGVWVDSSVQIKNMEPDKCKGWEWTHIDKLPELFCDTNNQIIKFVQNKN